MVPDQIHPAWRFGVRNLAAGAKYVCKMRYIEFRQQAKFTMTQAWYYFWIFDFAVAGTAFIVILALVAVKGFADLLAMFRLLDEERDAEHQQGPTQ